MNEALVHIAGPPLQIGYLIRQRCIWCGALIIDDNLENTAAVIPDGEDHAPEPFPTWAVGALVAVDRHFRHQVAFDPDKDELPSSCCARIDPAVTT